MTKENKVRSVLSKVLQEAYQKERVKVSERVKDIVNECLKLNPNLTYEKALELLTSEKGHYDLDALTAAEIYSCLIPTKLELKEDNTEKVGHLESAGEYRNLVMDAMAEISKVLYEGIPSEFNTPMEFIVAWAQDLPWNATDFMVTVSQMLHSPQYQRILKEFKKKFKLDVEEYLSSAMEYDAIQFFPSKISAIPMHLNSVQKKGVVLKEAEEMKSTNILEVFDEVRTNLQDAQSSLVINVPNKYQQLYKDELAHLYEMISEATNYTLQLAKKLKSELQQ